ncbi:MAG: monovalent cation/H+ antiporter subunit D family protein [Rhodospirillales bacterium]|nr:MAG: monovalent cation/H+ antiporter subunit D family protein [Rhodospirillales bacterium]
MLAVHFPALQVVLPLLAAPVCVLLRGARLSWLAALSVSWAAFAIAALLLAEVLAGGPLSYALGGWAPPWGIEFRVDAPNAFVLLIVAGIGAIVTLYAPKSVAREVGEERAHLFYTAYLLCLAGLLGVTITGDAFNLFVFLEISSLSSYILISLGQDRRALYAAYQYLILGTIGATLYLIGVGLLYQATGTLNMVDLAQRLASLHDVRGVRVAFAFLAVGLSLKLALFPLHLWLPNAYTYAPSAVTAFLAATATKVAVYALLRFLFTVFGAEFSFSALPMGPPIAMLAVLAMFTASIVAIFQENIKRMLAYSSVAQIGYMMLGISLVTVEGLTASILHVFNHALMKGALFLAMGCIYYRISSVHIADFAGLAKRMPWTMAAFVGGGLSLIGVPLTAGFISKWYLVLAALDRDLWPVAALIVLSSLLAVIYVWRVVEQAYFRPPPPGHDTREEAPLALLIPTWMLVAANVYFGVHAGLTVRAAGRAAQTLLGGAP